MVEIGGIAPLFTLPGTDGTPEGRRDYSLADHAGRPVVLVFYPADHSPVCTLQLATYSGDITRFAEVGADVLAISPQSVDDHEAFAAANGGFGFPLLSDVDAWARIELLDRIPTGSSYLVLAGVTAISDHRSRAEQAPRLVYADRTYRRLA